MMIPADDPRLAPIYLRRELLASGHNDKTLAAALRRGTFRRPRTGAYVDGRLWDALTPEQRFAIRSRAAYRQAKTAVVLSHSSSLPFLDGAAWGLDLAEVHLTRLDGKAGRREAGVRQHCGGLLDADITEAYGLRMTSPLRTSLDVASAATVEAALCVVNQFLHRGDFTLDRLRERYADGMERWPNSLRTNLVLQLADGRMESVGESRFSYHAWKQGLPAMVPQYEVVSNGVLVARLDFALPDYGVWIEFDGKGKYVDHLVAGQTAADVVLREKKREDMIREVTGWRCLRITWADLADPVRLAARIRDFIGRRAA